MLRIGEEQKGITGREQRRKIGNLLIVRVMGKQLRWLLSWVKSETIIGVCMLRATKVPDASPQMNAAHLLSPFSGWLEEENAEVSSFQNHYLKLAPVAITGSALKNIYNDHVVCSADSAVSSIRRLPAVMYSHVLDPNSRDSTFRHVCKVCSKLTVKCELQKSSKCKSDLQFCDY